MSIGLPGGEGKSGAALAFGAGLWFHPAGNRTHNAGKAMSLLARWGQRLLIFVIAATTIWFVVTQIFDRIDQRLPWFAALLATYLVAAYLILPVVIKGSLALMGRNRIPRVTRAGDGMAADPVNLVLSGSLADLRAAFAGAGWTVADPLTLRTGWRMIVRFVSDRPYPAAPFSPLYLFGRPQDIGFQQAVGNSPRKRHHVRFWAADAEPPAQFSSLAYWTQNQTADFETATIWIGAATIDLGFGFQSLTFQVSHRVDRHADPERDYIIQALGSAGRIMQESMIEAGAPVGTHFISDGRVVHARLRPEQ